MFVRYWGTRGSIASPGSKTVRYGGNTSCVEVRTQSGTVIVLDAGTGLRPLGEALKAEGYSARRGHLLIGHTHWDHIQGFPFFAPLFDPDNEWDVYAPKGFGTSLRETLAGQMQYTYFPVDLKSLGAKVRYHELVEGIFMIGEARVTTWYLNHPALTLGYRLDADGVAVAYATDHECHSRAAATAAAGTAQRLSSKDARERRHCEIIAGSDLLIHDAQFTAAEYPDRQGWGHSTVEYAVDMALAGGIKRLALFHHDPNRTDDAVDELLVAARKRVNCAGGALELSAAAEGETVYLPMQPATRSPQDDDARVVPNVKEVLDSTVLVMGTDAVLRQRLCAIGEAEGLQVSIAAGAEDAIGIASRNPPALAFFEQATGIDDGFKLCRALRECAATADVPIIGIGSSDEPDSRLQAAGMTDWLATPFSDQYARTKMRAWLLRTRARWIRASKPSNEESRLRTLHELCVLDTPPESRFDRITRLTARVFNAPIAMISLVDKDRQWFKSRLGPVAPETPRDQAFCAHAILGGDAFVVPDALGDDRFADNPLVTENPRVRFYAGHPIAAPDGNVVGTLCVMDHRPRVFGDEELAVLRDLAMLAQHELFATANAL